MKEKTIKVLKGVGAVALGGIVLFGAAGCSSNGDQLADLNKQLTDLNTKVDALPTEAPNVEAPDLSPLMDKLDSLKADQDLNQEMRDKLFEEDVQDAAAETLLEDEVMSDRHLEENLMEFLNNNGFDVEDEDDVLSVSLRDVDLDWEDREEGEFKAEMKLRVKFFEDGDEDNPRSKTVFVDATVDDDDLEEVEDYEFRLE